MLMALSQGYNCLADSLWELLFRMFATLFQIDALRIELYGCESLVSMGPLSVLLAVRYSIRITVAKVFVPIPIYLFSAIS